MQTFHIAPSLLSADFANLGQESKAVLDAGADLLHFDVMDNHYVPNLTVGPLVCQALRDYGIEAPIDVHLMAKPVDHLIQEFAKAGASRISIHPEATDHLDRSLSMIHELGLKAGLALNPATPLTHLEYIIEKIDLILVMGVNPGFGGQRFINNTLNKIEAVRKTCGDLPIEIAVDGGIKIDNIREVAKAGANTFIAGSAIFDADDYANVINQMREQLKDL